jgi:hypothetical protein
MKLCKVCADEFNSIGKGLSIPFKKPVKDKATGKVLVITGEITGDIIFLDKPVPITECEQWAHRQLREALKPHPNIPFNPAVIQEKRWIETNTRAPSGEYES